METKFTARFQAWVNGEIQFSKEIFTNESDVESDMRMASNSSARTQYKSFETIAEAETWLNEEEENILRS